MDELVVYISDIPDGYSAFKLKLFLNNLLGSGQAVQEIKPSEKESVMEVHFKEDTYKYVAVAKSPLPLKFGSDTYQLVVTINKPGSENQTSSKGGEYFTPGRHSTTQDDPPTEYSGPSMTRAQSEGNFTDYTMQDRYNYSGQPAPQRRIYCYGVSPHICNNKPLIRKHMQQYGHVEDIWIYPNARRPFFKVLFKLHESARTALDHGSNITSVDTLRMQWDRDEANELRQGPLPNYNPPNQARGPQFRYDPQRDPYERSNPPRSPQYRNNLPHDPQGCNPPRQGQVKLRNPGNQRPRDNRRHSANIEGIRQDRRQHPRSDQRRARDQSRDAGRSSDQSAPVASAAPRTWEEIWESEDDLKRKADNCVLVQNVPEKTSNQSLELYFENTNRSGGGEVFMLFKLRDGILVVFYDQQVARNVCDKQEHYFEGQKLQVFPKTIPTMMKEQFIVSGVDDTKTSKDVLELFIESCSTSNLVPRSVEKMSQGKYMVSYDGGARDKDIDDIMNNIQQKKLENKTLEASRMCKSDCIKVANVSNEVSDDAIKLTFESKRRTEGGTVTYVQRYKEHALVFFSDFKVAERVVKTCTDNPLTLDSKHVKVTSHYHGVGTSGNAKKRNRKAKGSSSSSSQDTPLPGAPVISFKITVKPEHIAVIQLIQNSEKFLQHFVDEYKDLAQVNFTQPREAKSIIGLMVQPLEKPNEKYMNDQAKFESECKRRYGTYLSKFATTITHIDSKILKGVRLSKGWNESEQVVAIDAEVDVFVRWNHKRQGNIEITCRQGDVKTAIEFFKSRSKCVKESVPLKEIHFRAFVDCCIIDDLRETYKQRVDFFVENNAIHLSGNQYDVAEAKNEVLTKRINLDSCKLPGFPSQLTMFMVQSLNAADANKLQPGSVNLRVIIQEEFRQRNVKVSVQVQDDNIQLLYLDTTQRDKATIELSNLLKQVSIPCNESMDVMLQQHEWKRLRQGLCSNKNLRIIQNSHQNEIILLGLAGPFKGAQKNIEGFIRQNISGTNLVRMEYISAKFVENYFKDSLEKSSKGAMACVRWGISDGGGIEVKGKDVDVKKAVSWLQGIVKSIKTTQHQFSIPGIPAFFRDKDKSKSFLSFTEKENKCIIMVDSCTLPSWGNPYANMGNKLKPKIALKTVHSMRLQGSNVEVKILRGDITEVNCDAIVNASNDKLELRDAGISGSIKKKCGPTVQAEMNGHIASVGGTMLPGSAVSTSAGRMNCRRIIHVVGPVWKGDISDEVCEAYLKSCVSETLKEAERYNLTSVAMPAISCGVFGGSVLVCPRLMVETLVDHFMKPSSCIKQIYFVENSNNEVIQSFSRSLQGYSNSPPQSAVTPQPIFTPAITPRHFARTTTGSALNVRLVQGDISTQNVDVIVTTGSPQNFAKGSGSAITQALIRIAGPQLQNAMIQAGQTQSYQVGDVVHTSGYRLQCTEVYHVIVANYQPNSHINSEHNLVKAIKTCLQNADQAGYATIAFPTLATGGFGYPAKSVARWMKRELDSFKPKHLKQVVIVMLPTDSGAMVFQNEFNSQTQRNQLSSSQSSKTIGSINVIVKQGDITIENSDAIICPTAQSYDLSGQVGQAILQRGGQSIQTELQQQLFTQNNYSVTGAGQLACKHVFHIVTGNDGTQMENVLMEVFEQADSLRIHSLSIPAIGTGNNSLTSSAAARHINRAIHIFEGNVRTSPTLQQINIVVFQHQMMADFQQEFGVSASQANVASKSNQLGLPKFFSAVQDTDNVTLYICSNQQNNVDKALKSINQHIQNITSVKYIDDEIIKQLTSIEVKEIGQLARKHQVKIETTETAFVTRMIIRGIKESVLETYSRVVEIISQLKQAVSCAELVQWKYRGNAQEGEFPLRVNLKLEETYKKKPKGKVLVRINSNSQQRNYNIDFSTMKEHCVQTNQTFDIIRTAVGETAFPNTWEDLQGNPWKVFQVQAGSNEYNQVIQKFQQGAAYIQTIVKLERIQNVALYKQFLAQEEKVRAKMSSRGVGQTVTRELFHGTSGDVTDNIYRNGFDRSHAGKNATAYGKGVYFAVQAQYSHHYTSLDRNNHRCMFLSKVVTGEYCAGKSSMITAPAIAGGQKNELYDSVVDSVSNPIMYVVFKDASVYPDYVLTYQ